MGLSVLQAVTIQYSREVSLGVVFYASLASVLPEPIDPDFLLLLVAQPVTPHGIPFHLVRFRGHESMMITLRDKEFHFL